MDQLKELPKRILEWWNKFSTKQKTIVVGIVAGVIVALALLVTVLTRKQYVPLTTCETTAEAAEVVDLLESNNFDYETNTEGTTITILDSQEAEARLLLGSNNIPNMNYTIDDVTDGGFSTTESDKQKRYVVYMQEYMEEILESNSSVKKATV